MGFDLLLVSSKNISLAIDFSFRVSVQTTKRGGNRFFKEREIRTQNITKCLIYSDNILAIRMTPFRFSEIKKIKIKLNYFSN